MTTKVINGKTFKAFPFSVEFVTYMEEHEYFNYATRGVSNEILTSKAKEALLDVLQVDQQLEEKQRGWNSVLVERIR